MKFFIKIISISLLVIASTNALAEKNAIMMEMFEDPLAFMKGNNYGADHIEKARKKMGAEGKIVEYRHCIKNTSGDKTHFKMMEKEMAKEAAENDEYNDIKSVTLIDKCPMPANAGCDHGSMVDYFYTDSSKFLKELKEDCDYLKMKWLTFDSTAGDDVKYSKDLKGLKGSEIRAIKGSSLPWANDKQLALEKLKENGDAYSMLNQELKIDRDVVEMALKNKTSLFMIDKRFAKDKDLTLLALKYKPEDFNRIDESLKSDPDILLASLNSRYDRALKNLDQAPEELKSNPEFMLKVLKLRAEKQVIQRDHHINNIVLFPYVANGLKKDEAFIKNAVSVAGSFLCDLEESYKSNRELALKAVKQYGNTLICLDKKLQEDREIALTAVKQDGMAILILAGSQSKYTNDKEIALAAINQAGAHAFQGVGPKLQNDKDVVKLVSA